ncbi:hypothetical protein L6164_036604 [Bauhinia variegata]|uniref:Uncharacterized protein n=1 Tax=Bauhinia variegata TaxID=167791 RepID=A0ACB9KHK0_BAUVA|nr:hypothetical protein L6164_036604 [Bauhinia variegata]
MADASVDYLQIANGNFDGFNGGDNDVLIDLDTILSVLDEDSDPSESSRDNSSLKNVSPGESGIRDNSQLHSGDSVIDYENENQGPSLRTCSSQYAFLESEGVCSTERAGFSGSQMPIHGAEAHLNNLSDCGNSVSQSILNGDKESQFRPMGDNVESGYASHSPMIGDFDLNFGHYGAFDEDTAGGVSGQQENDSCSSLEMSFMDADRSSHIATSIDSTICQGSNVLSDYTDYNSSLLSCLSTDDRPFVADSYLGYLANGVGYQFWSTKEETMTNVKDEKVEFLADTARVSSGMHSTTSGGIPLQDSKFVSPDSGHSYFGNVLLEDKGTVQPSHCAPYMRSLDQATCVKGERNELIMAYQNSSHLDDTVFNTGQVIEHLPGIFPVTECQSFDFLKHEDKNTVITSNGSQLYQDINYGTSCTFPVKMGNLNLETSDESLLHAETSIASEKKFGCVKSQGEIELFHCASADSHLSKVGTEVIHRDFLEKSHIEDDSDVCIIEDISHPAPTSRFTNPGNSLSVSQCSTYDDARPHMAVSTRAKAYDERYILRVALQDLSQPKSEVTPPDGLLSVPLLRHQRIALSWMVQKETSSLYCSGGILADDQGLGKTVSTIALLLKERPSIFRPHQNAQKSELETLNLDADDDVLPQNGGTSASADTSNGSSNPTKSMDRAKARPSAGTLIVCPTSVLRQWAEELNTKVTSKANLAVLVHHGSNRSKDPYELAKYDVVITTYSIITMEVPKQPVVDREDDEKGNSEYHAVPPTSSSRKRKCPSNSSKSGKKGSDSALLDAIAGPLAKVAWFRVVLDEAQSIKNHRTQVARACWGLRAKRRWCLSGTPIQNAIDDLYSYFRFLRYDPYAVYQSFCSTIKIPISRNPSKGYKKLQAVLKTIMLRRTKGTLLDGEPIISLPPKSVELRKVEFSPEERDFYSRLEADSRAQFQEYADAGTVKQNYVNILLMLLRLRQACDHPLLVRPYNSNTLWKSSEMAKKLPREKQISLLNSLEDNLALCRICNDPPEDAVVASCGHVFCNQCICEHLNADSNQCPATNCKARLNLSSVFSKSTLSSSLSDQTSDNLPGRSDSEVVGFEPCSQSLPHDSSKIKAALEVLQSLCKPQGHTSNDISMQSTSGESGVCIGNSFMDSPESQNLSGDGSCNASVTMVGEKAIVFSQWTRMLDLLEACLKNSSIQYRRLDGTMSVLARDKAVKDFNTLPEVSVMIMSLKAASLGLNMVAACHVLLLDLWWNPTTEDQAIDRAHRIGQTRPVTVLRLTVKDTVEDRILALQQKKRKMVSSAFGEDGSGGRQSRLTVDDLKYLFMM